MAHSLSQKPTTMAIQTIPSILYLEWIVAEFYVYDEIRK